jgi:hypothetical protein
MGIVMRNNYVTTSTHVLLQPYIDSKKNWKVFNSNYTLCGRIKHLVAAIFLAIPLINYIAYLILRAACMTTPNPLGIHHAKVLKPENEQEKGLDDSQTVTSSAVKVSKIEIPAKSSEPTACEATSPTLNTPSVTAKKPNLPLERRYPPVVCADSVIALNSKESGLPPAISAHGKTEVFKDEDILEVHEVIKKEEIDAPSGVYIEKTKHDKAIIQQQATRGCTAAVAAMLIVDNGKKTSLNVLANRNLGIDVDIIGDIEAAGLKPLSSPVNSLTDLRSAILNNGSAIVSGGSNIGSDDESESDTEVDIEAQKQALSTSTIEFVAENSDSDFEGDSEDDEMDIGSHVVIVDDVSEDLKSVRLRDPYHGWEITVKTTAFEKFVLYGSDVIQIGK